MNTKLVGLDMGSSSIKIASVKKNGEAFAVESVAALPSTPRGLASESLSDLTALSDVIKKLLASSNIKTTSAAISLPENQVYTKIVEMPDLSSAELSAALKFEMEQYIPLPLDQARTDWEILSKNDASGKKTIDVMIIAAPLALLEKYEKVLSMAGLTAAAVETEIVSEHRALLPLVENSSSHIIVHIGATTTTLAITRGGAIKMVFSLATGGAAITRAISLDFGIDPSQAEDYKKTYGLSKDAFAGKVGTSLLPILESISGDIKKAILAFREKNNNENIKQVILSGGSSLLPGIVEYFSGSLGVPVAIGSCFSAYNMQNVPDELVRVAPAYNVVFGLALRNLL